MVVKKAATLFIGPSLLPPTEMYGRFGGGELWSLLVDGSLIKGRSASAVKSCGLDEVTDFGSGDDFIPPESPIATRLIPAELEGVDPELKDPVLGDELPLVESVNVGGEELIVAVELGD